MARETASGAEPEGDELPPNYEWDALRGLDRFRRPVRTAVARLNRIPWLERVGEPESWDDQVVRVWDRPAALAAAERRIPLASAVTRWMEEVGKISGRWEMMDAAHAYWIARFAHPEAYLYADPLTQTAIHFDCVGALWELILDEVMPIRFRREAIRWYERGHWLCGIAEDGRRIVW